MYMSIRARGLKQGNGLWTTLAMLLAFFAIPAEAAPLALISQPGSQTIKEGRTIYPTMSATSDRTITYTWFKNSAVVGSNSASLRISSATPADAGTYSCRVSDGVSTINCKPFTISVSSTSDLVLNSQPSNTTLYEGGSTTFRMGATSSRAMTYSWTRNGTVVGTGSSLTISNATQTNAGTYGCTVTDGIRTLSCTAFALTVNSAVRITQQPSNTTINQGGSATFAVATSGSLPVTYSWTRNGTVIGNTRSITISNATLNNAGTYGCTVNDGVRTVSCSAFTLAVNAPLAITQQPANTSVYEGGSTTFSVTASSTQTLNYSWTRNGTVIGNTRSITISNATLNNAGTYGCTVSDGTRTVSCSAFTLTVNQIVRITQQPVSQMLNEGANASLSVAATGTAPINYQWYYNGTAISGATSNSLSIAPAQVSHSGSYHVVVRNAGSNATSSTATLSIAAVVQTGSAMISWNAPTTRSDGSTLAASQIAGYELYHSASSANGMTKLTSLNANELSIVVDDLEAGTHYFALATKDVNGLQSALSSTITVTIR